MWTLICVLWASPGIELVQGGGSAVPGALPRCEFTARINSCQPKLAKISCAEWYSCSFSRVYFLWVNIKAQIMSKYSGEKECQNLILPWQGMISQLSHALSKCTTFLSHFLSESEWVGQEGFSQMEMSFLWAHSLLKTPSGFRVDGRGSQ